MNNLLRFFPLVFFLGIMASPALADSVSTQSVRGNVIETRVDDSGRVTLIRNGQIIFSETQPSRRSQSNPIPAQVQNPPFQLIGVPQGTKVTMEDGFWVVSLPVRFQYSATIVPQGVFLIEGESFSIEYTLPNGLNKLILENSVSGQPLQVKKITFITAR